MSIIKVDPEDTWITIWSNLAEPARIICIKSHEKQNKFCELDFLQSIARCYDTQDSMTN